MPPNIKRLTRAQCLSELAEIDVHPTVDEPVYHLRMAVWAHRGACGEKLPRDFFSRYFFRPPIVDTRESVS
jgi:hypothetical protein